MSNNFGAKNYKEFIPKPVCEAYPQYNEFYEKLKKDNAVIESEFYMPIEINS